MQCGSGKIMEEFIVKLVELPDGSVEIFLFEFIDELKEEFSNN